ncbi:MAG: response regulator, partial [Bacteroidetes bacterium]|nr:response regulator [Bacteroidota bacterium]
KEIMRDVSKRILIVEDDENDLDMTLDVLKSYNLKDHIDIVRDGADAADYIFKRGKWSNRAGGNPVVVFIDLKLTKIDGIELLKRIRADEKTKYIPFVILTSSQEEKNIIEGYCLETHSVVIQRHEYADFLNAVKSLNYKETH